MQPGSPLLPLYPIGPYATGLPDSDQSRPSSLAARQQLYMSSRLKRFLVVEVNDRTTSVHTRLLDQILMAMGNGILHCLMKKTPHYVAQR